MLQINSRIRIIRRSACGEVVKSFDYCDNTTWYCIAGECEKNGIIECNTGRRHYWRCDSKEQIQDVFDNIMHCLDRSDERARGLSPILWDRLPSCGSELSPGVKCSSQGLPIDCLDYSRWGNERTAMKCSELGGWPFVHKKICSNNILERKNLLILGF